MSKPQAFDARAFRSLHRQALAEGARIRAIPGLLGRARTLLAVLEGANVAPPEGLRGGYIARTFVGFAHAEMISIDFAEWIYESARRGEWIDCRPGDECGRAINERGDVIDDRPVGERRGTVPVRIGLAVDPQRLDRGHAIFLAPYMTVDDVAKAFNEPKRWALGFNQLSELIRGRPAPRTPRGTAWDAVNVLRERGALGSPASAARTVHAKLCDEYGNGAHPPKCRARARSHYSERNLRRWFAESPFAELFSEIESKR